ncbi:CGAS synthase, partial [Polypterus senegalus]
MTRWKYFWVIRKPHKLGSTSSDSGTHGPPQGSVTRLHLPAFPAGSQMDVNTEGCCHLVSWRNNVSPAASSTIDGLSVHPFWPPLLGLALSFSPGWDAHLPTRSPLPGNRAKSPGEAGRRATSPPPPAPIPANEAAPRGQRLPPGRVSGTSQGRATNSATTRRGSFRDKPSSRQGSTEDPIVEEAACPEQTPPPSPDFQVPAEEINLNRMLLRVLDSIKIRKKDISEASMQVNDIMKKISSQLKDLGVTQLNMGSYYEFLKISDVDEFDFMLTMPVARVALETFGKEVAFYHVSLKRNPIKCLRKFVVDETTLSADKMLTDFREKIKKILREFKVDAHVQRKKPGCPAITLSIKNAKGNGKDIEVDIVPGLEVHSSWPSATNEDAWRISFSNIEKKILKEHGQTRTCCEAYGVKCCRKECLKLLKYLLERLKEKHPRELSKFSSYFMKTTLLHACAKQPEDTQWSSNNLSQCFLQLLTDLIEYLRLGNLPHFFIPEHNLLETITTPANRMFLVSKLEYEINNMFPIFRAL